jgi:hypothetical protein
MRRLLPLATLLLGTLLVGTCSDDDGAKTADPDAGSLLPPSSALERPTDLPRPPEGRLPRDLLPPTF